MISGYPEHFQVPYDKIFDELSEDDNLSEGTGFILFKTNSVEDLHLWSLKWSPISSCERCGRDI